MNQDLLDHDQPDKQLLLVDPEQNKPSSTAPALAQLDSKGHVRIDITVPKKVLTLGPLLGQGSYGSVYKGEYKEKPVAIKVFDTHLDAQAEEEFRREAQILFHLGLESEYVVPLKKICIEPLNFCMVMDLMECSLYHLLYNGKDLPWTLRWPIVLDIVYGLKDLHAYHIIHRDLKSANILIKNGRAKLADFGLAKVKNHLEGQFSSPKGTLLWMAPEQLAATPQVTTASDIYSFGIVLLELVTRQLPRNLWSLQNGFLQIAEDKREEVPLSCPSELRSVIDSCRQLLPAKRPTATQVAQELKLAMSREMDSKETVLSDHLKAPSLKGEPLHPQGQIQEAPLPLPIATPLKNEKKPLTDNKLPPTPSLQPDLSEQKQHLTPVSTSVPMAQNRHILLPQPQLSKMSVSKDQLTVQDVLVTACEQGDLKAAQALFKTTLFRRTAAKPNLPNSQGKYPLPAAIYGMNPLIVGLLQTQAKGAKEVNLMSWDQCQEHNQHWYGRVFAVSQFAPQSYSDWYHWLEKMRSLGFVKECHLQEVVKEWSIQGVTSWESLELWVDERSTGRWRTGKGKFAEESHSVVSHTEAHYAALRDQIQRQVATTSTYSYQNP